MTRSPAVLRMEPLAFLLLLVVYGTYTVWRQLKYLEAGACFLLVLYGTSAVWRQSKYLEPMACLLLVVLYAAYAVWRQRKYLETRACLTLVRVLWRIRSLASKHVL